MKSRLRSRRVKRSKKNSKRSKSRKMSTRYTMFKPDEPYDEDHIKNCHKFQKKVLSSGAVFRTRPSAVWCKEAKHFLKSLKKSKSKSKRSRK